MNEFPTYFLIISTVVCACLIWIHLRAKKKDLNLKLVLDLSLAGLILGFVGARLTHVFYEYPEIYWENPWRVFDFARGGYVYYGGLIAGLLAGYLMLRWRGEKSHFLYLDLFTPVISFGYAMGRMACLLAGCCYGPATDLPWAIHSRHPTPLYSTLLELILLIFILWLEGNKARVFKGSLNFSGSLFFLWLLFHSLTRFILEFWRDDFRGPEYIFSFSGWISLLLFCLSIYLFLTHKKSLRS